MIQLYTWATPNGKKLSIMLEEVGLPYEVRPVNLSKGEQMKPEYLAVNPNNKIPSIIDSDGPGGQPAQVVRIGRDLDLSRREDGDILASGYAQALRSDSVADVSDGRCWADVWTGKLFFPFTEKFPTPLSVFIRRRCAYTKSWIRAGRRNISPASTPSPTSPRTLGFGGTIYTR